MSSMIAISEASLGLPIEWSGSKPWYRPTFSPEHGVLLVLFGAVLTGASLAQAWTWQTSLAFLGAFLGLQAEHPLTVQIKQRRSLKPRYLLWTAIYGAGAIAIAGWLTLQHPCLIWVCGGGAIALGVNVWAVLRRQQKVIATEISMFSAICLSTLFAYGTTADGLTTSAVGFWILNTLFFSSAVFTIKLRKIKTSSLQGSLVYHGSAIALISLLYGMGWLLPLTALTFAIAVLKLVVIIGQRDWYCNCRFEYIARFETYFALSYTALACLTVLPARLPPPV
ncbi:YwiC-like family protein [Oscillatoria sp. CS-180]|uniref:YwiC-like family protein n=1 Tax=Oscillatoria sp. CS-180 TaxID=3021720 RepID=UPI00232E71AB|nr:YwiC-like family protein [Oscillatoria sp. CS-180]MDB9527619.1 YwiC-like family protein [Oscillatoria sp. CS-180]